MRRPSVSQPPTVSLSIPDEPECIPNAWVVLAVVQQVVDTMWSRLPEPVREIIALELEGVLLFTCSTGMDVDMEDNCILLCLAPDQDSLLWEQTMTWELAHSFGYVFLRSVARRMARANTPETQPSTTDPCPPAAAWLQSFDYGSRQPAYQRITEQAAVALRSVGVLGKSGPQWRTSTSLLRGMGVRRPLRRQTRRSWDGARRLRPYVDAAAASDLAGSRPRPVG